MRAAEFARKPKEPVKNGGFRSVPPQRASKPPAIVCTFAQDLSFIPDGTVDIVLTDPPYFDNIAYSELAEFFLPWMQLVGLVSKPIVRNRMERESLVARRHDADATIRFTTGLSDAFQEVARVLKTNGLLIFSFRHVLPEAWFALALALARTEFRVTHVLPAPGEAGVGLHARKGTGLWDAVFVLRNGQRRNDEKLCVDKAGESHVKSLVAEWAGKLMHTRLPFTEVDHLVLRRATLVAVALGLLGTQPDSGACPLYDLLSATIQK